MGVTAASASSKATNLAADPPMVPDPKQALLELDQAIDLIPAEEKGAYLRAVRTVPELVQLESPPLRYLRFDSYNPWAAARRLVDYWEGRVDLFGTDRAFMPLRLTSPLGDPASSSSTASTFQSALDELDVQVVNCGFYMVLPKDSRGRPVLVHDRSRLPNQPEAMDPSRRLRCFFYMMHVLVEQMEASGDSSFEASYITVFGNKTRRASIDFQMVMRGLKWFGTKQILPFRFSSWHVVLLGTRNFVLQRVVPFTVQTCEALGTNVKPTTFRIHELDDEKDVEKLQEELQAAGFGLEGLPKVGLDGLWTIGCFKCWIETRIRTERRMYSGKWDESASAHAAAADSAATHDEDDVIEEQQRKRRQLEAAYARRKRARRKINQKVLQDELRRHQTQKQQLLQTNQHLERLLEEAKSVVRLHATENEKGPQQLPAGQDSYASTRGRIMDTPGLSNEVSDRVQPPVLAERYALDPRGTISFRAAASALNGLSSNHLPDVSYSRDFDPLASAVSSQMNVGRLFEPPGARIGGVVYAPSHHHLGNPMYAATSSATPMFNPSPAFQTLYQAPSRTDLLVSAILSSRSASTASAPQPALDGSILGYPAANVPPSVVGSFTLNLPNPRDSGLRDRFREYFGL